MTVAPPTTPPAPLAQPPPPPPPPPLSPVGESQRVLAVDVLRGFALLGILAMNIISFALPMDAYMIPTGEAIERYAGSFTGATYATWLVAHVLIDQKMMSIFSMLFGAGLVLMGGRSPFFGGVYYRRLLWLFLIGMVHAYLLWYGDILVTYALCGLLLYPVRNWRPRTLIPVGIAVTLVAVLIEAGLGASLWFARDRATRGDPEIRQAWAEISAGLTPSPQKVDEEVAAFRGSWPQVLRANAIAALFMQLALFPMAMLWRALGLMLAGMGLMKLGVFSAARSRRFYWWMLVVGYGIGLPVVTWGAFDQVRHGFDMVHALLIGWHYNYVGSLFVAAGHVALVMLVVKSGALTGFTSRLGDVGRMALTNYLAQTLICTFIFFGWGLGYFGYFERKWLPLFVLGVWAI